MPEFSPVTTLYHSSPMSQFPSLVVDDGEIDIGERGMYGGDGQELELLSEQISFQQSRASFSPSDNGASIAAELVRLSLREREEILHDLHGVAPPIPETLESVQAALEQLHSHLDECYKRRTSASPSSVYLMALQSPDSTQYVRSPSFGLLFLRSELFNVPAAAHKLIRFLQVKLELFGPSAVFRTITLEDLGTAAREALELGYFQLLPARDRAGRAIFCFASQVHCTKTSVESELRSLYYIVMSALEDSETQVNGIIMIPWGLPKNSPWHAWRVNTLMSAMPFQIKGWHSILSETLSPWLSWLTSILDQKARTRMRVHTGTYQEIMYSLLTFGIPTTHIPVQMDETVDRSHHLRWIQARQDLEGRRRLQQLPHLITPMTTIDRSHHDDHNGFRESDSSQGYQAASTPVLEPSSRVAVSDIYLPTSKDILFGRGKPFQQHAGNLRLSMMLESLQERYETLPRHEKTTLAEDVVRGFQANGSRFLRRATNDLDGVLWEEVKDSEAREKVSQLFRSMRQAKQHTQQENSLGSNSTPPSEAPTSNAAQSRKRGRRNTYSDDPSGENGRGGAGKWPTSPG